MKQLKKVSTLLLALSVAGCAAVNDVNQENNAYLKAKNTEPTKIPQDLKTKKEQTYYPIPTTTQPSTPTAQPSLVPPGSMSVAPRASQQSTVSARALPQTEAPKSVVAESSTTSLQLNLDSSEAWAKVGKALHGSGYKVMQQDKSMGSYYVLDLAGTGGVLKTNTPIYQVHISSSGNSSTVTLLNDKNQMATPAVSSRILGAVKRGL